MQPTRREILKLVGAVGGSALMYQVMGALGVAGESDFKQRIALQGRVKNASVLVLGAGLAGLVAAVELAKAGYRVQVLEYNPRPGGRSWTIRGGDTFTELGGATQTCRFEKGQYFNAGPMRIPFSHHGFIHYCREFSVPLEPFLQANSNAYVHSEYAFGGKPQRYSWIQSDFEGHVAELLAKAVRQHTLDRALSTEDAETLLEALRRWGALDSDFRYLKGEPSSGRRGFAGARSAGLNPPPPTSVPIALTDLLKARFWECLAMQHHYDWLPPMFQPVGGMDRLPTAMASHLAPLITYGAKVTEIHQDAHAVTVTYADVPSGANIRQARADWCVCTIPGSILGQIPMDVGPSMSAAIAALFYASTVKVALQFKRRFWEEDESIYGGTTFTDLPINQIVYPSHGCVAPGKGVVISGYVGALPGLQPLPSYAMTSASPEERIQWALREGAKIHPQFRAEFDSGFSIAWHRVPSSLGCIVLWHGERNEQRYKDLCAIDGRIVLAGEHASRLAGWQEGAILSSLDAIGRLHPKVLAAEHS